MLPQLDPSTCWRVALEDHDWIATHQWKWQIKQMDTVFDSTLDLVRLISCSRIGGQFS